jgi:hypothetical protein
MPQRACLRLRTGLFVQGLSKLLQAGNDLRRLRKHRAGKLFGVIRTALRHLGECHHHGERVVNGMFDLAELLLKNDDLFLRDGVR